VKRCSVPSSEYAVFDIETTGFELHPDSIVEIAVVHVDAHGEITGMWDTLLRPDGDNVGPTYVHGVSPEMVRNAPRFSDVGEHLYGLFADRVPVAHRLPQFDGRFMASHFDWAGIPAPGFKHGLCTWKLARRSLPLENHTLKNCCDHLGIELVDAHQALTDTVATARLLGHFIRAGHPLEGSVIPPRNAPDAAAARAREPLSAVFLPRSRVAQDS